MLPIGFSEIKQLPDAVSDNKIRNFSQLINTQNFTDIIKIQTDISGKMLSLYSEVNKITIKSMYDGK